MNAYNQYPTRPAALKHFILKAIQRNSPKSGNPELFQFGGLILHFQTLLNHLKMSLFRHGRACPGHPRLSCCCTIKTMPGTGPGIREERGTAARLEP
jgi:hypothetical protein